MPVTKDYPEPCDYCDQWKPCTRVRNSCKCVKLATYRACLDCYKTITWSECMVCKTKLPKSIPGWGGQRA